ncbi:uncharacterized protein KIAA1143 homolog [Limulus polyphemus]|uniref:Uncharacterized protein KIAA1143 homolog n=1 Tax=Limulus polyphemus TaxID=6850 RepID=A0ABM1B5B0_LIMPO|nr:uncharacterized protein KIAA1143 homolog [Limulus polyphemus]
MASKRNITFSKPAEPSFLKKFKERIGYQEGPTVQTKKQLLPVDDTSDEERDDEKPLVVVLEKGDLTSEEAENYKYSNKPATDDEEGLCGEKILFKKPTKRSIKNDENPTKSCTKKKTKDKDTNQPKKVKNSCLLSFDEDEEEG